jgi:hypothetical protein
VASRRRRLLQGKGKPSGSTGRSGGGGRRRMRQQQKKDAATPSGSRARSGGGRMEPWMWRARVRWGIHDFWATAQMYRINRN